MDRGKDDQRRAAGPLAAPACGARAAPAAALPLHERAVLANQQFEVLALLVGELQEDALAFGVLEALAVSLEEAVRAALAADADHQRLPVVDAVAAAARRPRRTGRWRRP